MADKAADSLPADATLTDSKASAEDSLEATKVALEEVSQDSEASAEDSPEAVVRARKGNSANLLMAAARGNNHSSSYYIFLYIYA